MKRPPPPGFVLVATRELRWIVRDKIALFLMLGVALIGATVLSLTFSNAVIRGLNTVIVDADRTPTSLPFVQAILTISALENSLFVGSARFTWTWVAVL